MFVHSFVQLCIIGVLLQGDAKAGRNVRTGDMLVVIRTGVGLRQSPVVLHYCTVCM